MNLFIVLNSTDYQFLQLHSRRLHDKNSWFLILYVLFLCVNDKYTLLKYHIKLQSHDVWWTANCVLYEK